MIPPFKKFINNYFDLLTEKNTSKVTIKNKKVYNKKSYGFGIKRLVEKWTLVKKMNFYKSFLF